MAENSKIEWTTHTFCPWEGCTKVSPGCANCYAEARANRFKSSKWGPNGTRVVRSESYWREPVKWNKAAACSCGGGFRGTHSLYCPQADRPRVFCASLADVFEDWAGAMLDSAGRSYYVDAAGNFGPGAGFADRHATMNDVRHRLFALIGATPNLDWLILTKRPENALRMMVQAKLYAVENPCLPCPQPNLWLGTSVENRDTMHRIDTLRKVPAAVRFLSVEPLLEDLGTIDLTGIHWVIVGCESGPKRRPMQAAWAQSIVDQCAAAGVKCFVKQVEVGGRVCGEVESFQPELRIRQFPTVEDNR